MAVPAKGGAEPGRLPADGAVVAQIGSHLKFRRLLLWI
jgi:hypothetical protein